MGPIGKGGRSVIKTMLANKFQVAVATTPGKPIYRNCLYLGSPDTSMEFEAFSVPDGLSLVDAASLNLEDAMVLSDDRPVLEHLNLPAASAWRKGYNQSFTSAFSANGVPLFK